MYKFVQGEFEWDLNDVNDMEDAAAYLEGMDDDDVDDEVSWTSDGTENENVVVMRMTTPKKSSGALHNVGRELRFWQPRKGNDTQYYFHAKTTQGVLNWQDIWSSRNTEQAIVNLHRFSLL